MYENIPADLLDWWIASYAADPWDHNRGDMQAGIVAATVANCMGRGKDQAPFTASDFMPRFNDD